MYMEHYGLQRQPFQLTPDIGFFYSSRAHKRGLATMTYGLSKNEGFVVVTGHVGAGKTMLIEYMLSRQNRSDVEIAKINTTQLEADSLLELIALEFGLRTQQATKATLLRDLGSYFRRLWKTRRHVLLIIDEVQNLSATALEELRMLSNFQENEAPLVQMLLVGQPEFRERLASPQCEQIRQRVIASYHLPPLQAADIAEYIEHRLSHAGWTGGKLFTDDAYQLIYDETEGVPRKINRLCDRALLFGYLENLNRLDAQAVNNVIADMRSENLSFTAPAMHLRRAGHDQHAVDGEPCRQALAEPGNARGKEGVSGRQPFRGAAAGGNGTARLGSATADGAERRTVQTVGAALAPAATPATLLSGPDYDVLVTIVRDLQQELADYKVKMNRIMALVSEGERLGQ